MVGPVERNVNVVQEVLESVGTRVGRIIRIITRTVGEVAQEVSGVVADGFEIAEASKRARADHERWNAEDLADAGQARKAKTRTKARTTRRRTSSSTSTTRVTPPTRSMPRRKR